MVHHFLVRGGGCISTVVKLPTGVFCNADVPAYVLIFGGYHGRSSGVLFVSTDGRFRGIGARGGLHPRRVGGVISACHRHGRVRGCDRLTALRRITRGSCGLGVPHCISAFRRRRPVSVRTIVGRVGSLRTGHTSLSGRVRNCLGRLKLMRWAFRGL